jgi:hypothetical protein
VFLDFAHRLMFLKKCFLKKYYTMDKVQKHDSSKCTTPLSEPFRIDFLVDLGLSMAQAVSRRPLTAGLGFAPRSVWDLWWTK